METAIRCMPWLQCFSCMCSASHIHTLMYKHCKPRSPTVLETSISSRFIPAFTSLPSYSGCGLLTANAVPEVHQ